jgi:tetratricopeptide (TPR) repeat protein
MPTRQPSAPPASVAAEQPGESLAHAALQVGLAILVAALVLTLYVWQARRTHAVKALVSQAAPLVDKGDVESLRVAEQLYLGALSVRRGHQPAICGLAETYAMLSAEHGIVAAGDQAQRYTALCVEGGTESPARYTAEALMALGEGQPLVAESLINALLARGAASERLAWLAGLAELAMGKAKLAREQLKRATDMKPGVALYAQALGDAFDEEGNTREASQAWELAAKANPKYVQGAARDLYSRVRRGESRPAVLQELSRLSSLPKEAVGPHALAAIRLVEAEMAYQGGLANEALRVLAEAAQSDGDSARLLELRGWVLLGDGQRQEGLAALQAAHARAPGADRYLYALADAYLELNLVDEALHLLQTAEDRLGVARHQAVLGRVFVAKKDWSRAKAAFDRALALEADCPEALLGYGVAAWKQQHQDEAVQWFGKALVQRPKFPEVYEALGLMWVEQGSLAQANPQLDMAEKMFRAEDTDVTRLRRFYAAVLQAYSAKGGSAYLQEWSAREKAFCSGTQAPLP